MLNTVPSYPLINLHPDLSQQSEVYEGTNERIQFRVWQT